MLARNQNSELLLATLVTTVYGSCGSRSQARTLDMLGKNPDTELHSQFHSVLPYMFKIHKEQV